MRNKYIKTYQMDDRPMSTYPEAVICPTCEHKAYQAPRHAFDLYWCYSCDKLYTLDLDDRILYEHEEGLLT